MRSRTRSVRCRPSRPSRSPASSTAAPLDQDCRIGSAPGSQRSMIAEVALAAGISVLSAQSLMSDVWELVTCNPHTLARLRTGQLQQTAARSIVNETAFLEDAALKALADEIIAAETVDVLPGKARALAERRAIDPDAAARRADEERAERHVKTFPGVAGTAFLQAYLPAEQAAACYTTLHDHARARHAAGDPRPIGHPHPNSTPPPPPPPPRLTRRTPPPAPHHSQHRPRPVSAAASGRAVTCVCASLSASPSGGSASQQSRTPPATAAR